MARDDLTPFGFIETPDQARRRTSLLSDLGNTNNLAGFMATLLGRGLQAARHRGPQKEAVQEAEAVQGALKRAMEGARYGQGAASTGVQESTSLDENSAFLVNAVKELNSIGRPDLAVQFAEKLGQAEKDRIEAQKDLLEIQGDRDALEEDRATSGVRTLFGLKDPESGEILGPFNLSNPAELKAYSQARAEAKAEGRVLLAVSSGDLAQMDHQERLAELAEKSSRARRIGPTQAFNDFSGTRQATSRVLRTITDMANVVRADLQAGAPNALGERARGLANSLGYHLRSLLKSNIGDEEYAELDEKARSMVQRSGLRNAQFQSLALDLAYALARVNDPSGRLSDFDVELAIRTTQAAQSDPTVLLSTLSMIARRSYERAREAYLGLEEVPEAQPGMQDVEQKYAALQEVLQSADIVDLSSPDDLKKYLESRQNQSDNTDEDDEKPRVVGVRAK